MNTETIIKVIYGLADRRLLIVFRRNFYTFRVQKRYCTKYLGDTVAEGWVDIPVDSSYFVDAESAERDVRARFEWLCPN
jgi:hypothetical protein